MKKKVERIQKRKGVASCLSVLIKSQPVAVCLLPLDKQRGWEIQFQFTNKKISSGTHTQRRQTEEQRLIIHPKERGVTKSWNRLWEWMWE